MNGERRKPVLQARENGVFVGYLGCEEKYSEGRNNINLTALTLLLTCSSRFLLEREQRAQDGLFTF